MLNLALMLESSTRLHPDRTAVVCGDRRLTYAEVNARANQVANLLRHRGIQPGDRVALSCPNIEQFPVVYYGILKAGAVVVPVNVLLTAREVAYHLEDSGATAYFCFEGTPELPLGETGWTGFSAVDTCAHFFLVTADDRTDSPVPGVLTLARALERMPTEFTSVATDPSDTALILYTSGTTGQPKGAELTHSNVVLNVLTCHRTFGTRPHDVHLVALPLFHTFGQTVQMNAGFGAGATLVLLPRFDAVTALRLMQREKVTVFAGVPTMYWGLLGADHSAVDLAVIAAELRLALSGGAALPVEILAQVQDVLGVRIHEGYGLSETSPLATFNHPDRETKAGSIGEPVWGVELRLIDGDWDDVPADAVGEIAIRGHNIMKGYLNRPDATAEAVRDGWFRTGDLARRDADGYYFIVDRAKDMIVRGGFNVYPRELEETIMTHPGVSLVAVVGVPHESHGEEVKAYVIKKSGALLDEASLIAWCKDNMASYKYPRIVEFREALPMTATGKLLKRALRP
ncbi:long-chain-fatty-acid--CoA ligase [Streptomyces muensis]|uniref:Long-chain fatty acid--CoA ligase n=1 Tax=Streptomyces muensis TaxID=1077944 RepID=A0A9X1PW11_STRM4|nr:long-chain fatty acid--CoA ligase [Streptomyces muensis]MCF1592296.1 long-chain fatty acid--CoA ligase [Streptomyces muensis]